MSEILSPGDAMSIGELLTAISAHKKVTWIAEGDDCAPPKTGELRSLVIGPSLAMAPWGTDVREMSVWVTAGIVETTFTVRHAMAMLPEGGMLFE